MLIARTPLHHFYECDDIALLPQEKTQITCGRLKAVMQVTQRRRQRWIESPDDFLSEGAVKQILDEWQADWPAWMSESSQDLWLCRYPRESARRYATKRFRAYLFYLCGCSELIKFWLRVKPCWQSLCIFHMTYTAKPEKTKKDKLELAVAVSLFCLP